MADADDSLDADETLDFWERLKSIVGEVAELAPEHQEAALQAACASDSEMLEEARSLLQSLNDSGDFLDVPASSAAAGTDPMLGARVGAYIIRDLIAKGGMGAVYRATHERTKQVVALKVLRSSFAPSDWMRRFQHEVQILGKLRHPAIAQIHDAGVMDGSSAAHHEALPYFVMEFIDGQSVSAYVRDKGLSRAQRLELMIRIAEAVHYAHQRGVIHRDLKPDNILITEAGHPKILDFGVARIKKSEGSELSQVTEVGQLLGTLSYMSPEQVSGSPDDIDTTADVYALGVILFELLCGKRPLALQGLPLPQAVIGIQEQDARPLSSFDRSLAGDLDTITAKALEKDPRRRYASASELAADLRRYLRNEAIAARPATAVYQLKKFARRHRGLVFGVTAAFLALAIGLVATLLYMFEAKHQTQLAKRATNQAEKEARSARQAEADSADFADFLEGIFESADLEVAGKSMTVVDLLDINAKRIAVAFKSKPHLRARLLSAIGWDYFSLGEYAKAEKYQRLALALYEKIEGPNSAKTIAEANHLNNSLIWMDRLDESDKSTAQTLARATQQLGKTHQQTGIARRYRAELLHAQKKLDQAEQAYRSLLTDFAGSTPDSMTLGAMNSLANIRMEQGDVEEAEDLYRRVYEANVQNYGKEHTKSLVILGNLLQVMARGERKLEALRLYKDLLRTGRRVWGPDKHQLWDLKRSYASLLQDLGKFEEALEINREVHQRDVRRHGPQHSDAITSLNNLCVLLIHLKRYEEAVKRAQELVEAASASRDEKNPILAQALDTHANALDALATTQTGDEQKTTRLLAKKEMEKALAINEAIYGSTHMKVLIGQNNYARVMQEMGFLEDAVRSLKKVVSTWSTQHPQAGAVERIFRWNLARALDAHQETAAAEREFELALALPEHPSVTNTRIYRYLLGFYEKLDKREKLAQIRKMLAQTPKK